MRSVNVPEIFQPSAPTESSWSTPPTLSVCHPKPIFHYSSHLCLWLPKKHHENLFLKFFRWWDVQRRYDNSFITVIYTIGRTSLDNPAFQWFSNLHCKSGVLPVKLDRMICVSVIMSLFYHNVFFLKMSLLAPTGALYVTMHLGRFCMHSLI